MSSSQCTTFHLKHFTFSVCVFFNYYLSVLLFIAPRPESFPKVERFGLVCVGRFALTWQTGVRDPSCCLDSKPQVIHCCYFSSISFEQVPKDFLSKTEFVI